MRDKNSVCHNVSEHILPIFTILSKTLPVKTLESVIRAQIDFSDPDFNIPAEFHNNLGNDIFEKIVEVKKRQLTDTLFVRDTAVGWTIWEILAGENQ